MVADGIEICNRAFHDGATFLKMADAKIAMATKYSTNDFTIMAMIYVSMFGRYKGRDTDSTFDHSLDFKF